LSKVKTWLDELNQTVADKHNKNLIQIIPEFSKVINKKLEEESFKNKIYVHICLLRLLVDDEIKT
jgi:hypothetical protein